MNFLTDGTLERAAADEVIDSPASCVTGAPTSESPRYHAVSSRRAQDVFDVVPFHVPVAPDDPFGVANAAEIIPNAADENPVFSLSEPLTRVNTIKGMNPKPISLRDLNRGSTKPARVPEGNVSFDMGALETIPK